LAVLGNFELKWACLAKARLVDSLTVFVRKVLPHDSIACAFNGNRN